MAKEYRVPRPALGRATAHKFALDEKAGSAEPPLEGAIVSRRPDGEDAAGFQ